MVVLQWFVKSWGPEGATPRVKRRSFLESLGEVRSILFGQQQDQSEDIGLSVFECECVCACVIASVWNNVWL